MRLISLRYWEFGLLSGKARSKALSKDFLVSSKLTPRKGKLNHVSGSKMGSQCFVVVFFFLPFYRSLLFEFVSHCS